MTLGECLEKTTHREYLVWMAWLRDRLNHPGLTEYYLMQIAMEVRRVLSNKPSSIRLEQFKLKFNVDRLRKPVQKMTKELATTYAKAKWFAITGYKPNQKVP